MKQFLYDDDGVKELISLAYRHGYERGNREDRAVTFEGLFQQVFQSSDYVDIGSILGGGEPQVYENADKAQQFYDDQELKTASRAKWFAVGAIMALSFLAIFRLLVGD